MIGIGGPRIDLDPRLGRLSGGLAAALSRPELDLVSGSAEFRRTLIAAAGYSYTRVSGMYQWDGDGQFTLLANDVAPFGPDGLQCNPGYTCSTLLNSDLTGAGWAPLGACNVGFYLNLFGSLPGSYIAATAVNDAHGMFRVSGLTAIGGNTYTLQLEARAAAGARYMSVRSTDTANNSSYKWVTFDLLSGVVTEAYAGATAGMIPRGGGVYLCYMTYAVTVTSGDTNIAIVINNSPGIVASQPAAYLGAGETLYVSSLVVTVGTAPMISPVVTASSAASLAGASNDSWIANLPGEYSYSAKWTRYALHELGLYDRVVDLGTVFDNSCAGPYLYGPPDAVGVQIRTGAVNVGVFPFSVTTPGVFRFAIRMKTNDIRAVLDGQLSAQDTSVSFPTYDRIGVGARATAGASEPSSQFKGALQKVPNPRVWRPALSDAALQALSAAL